MSIPRFCIATKPAPLLNTPDFQKVFGSPTLPVDEKGLLRCLETIALPGTKFEILQEISPFVLEVTTKDYPGKVFVDSRFVRPVSEDTPERTKILPSKETVLHRLKTALGLPYVWGGNWRSGIPEILELYRPPISQHLHSTWTLCGLDCSGLLYEATDGYTPRNTSELLHFGHEVSMPKQLDILIYPGHVIIIFDEATTIESRYGRGVVFANLIERMDELSNTKFQIRRFFP